MYKIEFQYKSDEDSRPDDCIQDEELVFEHEEVMPIPNVGDSVSLKWGDKRRAFKVLTRHFSYIKVPYPKGLVSCCYVNIVITDIEGDEMAARLKE